MTRAKEMALKAYPLMDKESHEIYLLRDGFINGYEQAEKDLALTCEDIQLIVRLSEEVMTEAGGTPKDYNEEILKRFNEQRNKQ